MKKKLTVKIEQLTEAQRSRIRSAAEKAGWEVCFADVEAAHPEHSEVVFSGDMALIRRCSGLKWLCVPSAGVEPYLAPGVLPSPDTLLTNSSGAYGVTIAEHVIMMTLELMRRQGEYTEIVRRREWVRDLPVRSIRGSRIALLGTGDLGQECAIRFRAFSPEGIVGVNRSGVNPRGLFDRVETVEKIEEVLRWTNLLVITLPGTEETFRLLDARRLALLPDGAMVINVGRGSVIDQKAMEAELRAGRLTAGLDVFEQEPLPGGDSMWDCPNLLITPHVAGNMTLPYTVDRIVELFLEDFENYCAGRPLCRRVDLKRGY